MNKIKVEVVWGFNEENDLFYISDKDTWVKHNCCADTLDTDVYSLLCDIGLAEEQDGIWSSMEVLTDTIKERLEDLGFEYDKIFEEFMSEYEE